MIAYMKRTHQQQYKIIVERGMDGYFVARVPSLPGCMTQAKTYEKVIDRAKEAIQLCREVAVHDVEYRHRAEGDAFVPTFIGVTDVAV